MRRLLSLIPAAALTAMLLAQTPAPKAPAEKPAAVTAPAKKTADAKFTPRKADEFVIHMANGSEKLLSSFRGKLVVIPIENAFLYVVPLYLRAEGTNFPQLKRVIVATGDKVVMRPTLDEALGALFSSSEGTAPSVTTTAQPPATASQPGKIDSEKLQLAAAQKAIDSLRALLNAGPAKQ